MSADTLPSLSGTSPPGWIDWFDGGGPFRREVVHAIVGAMAEVSRVSFAAGVAHAERRQAEAQRLAAQSEADARNAWDDFRSSGLFVTEDGELHRKRPGDVTGLHRHPTGLGFSHTFNGQEAAGVDEREADEVRSMGQVERMRFFSERAG